MAKDHGEGGKRFDGFRFDPNDLVIDGEGSPLHDPDSDAAGLDEGMLKNIMLLGVIEPVEFSRREGKNIVINGRKRTRHAREANKRLKAAGKEPITVPGIPYRGTEDMLLGLMVSANEFRRDKTPMERAKQSARLLNAGKTEDETAIHFGVDVQTIRNWQKILEASPAVKKAIDAGQIKATAGAQLAGLSKEEQAEKLEKLLDNSTGKATVRKAKKLASEGKPDNGKPKLNVTAKEILEVTETEKIPEQAKHALLWVLGLEERAWV